MNYRSPPQTELVLSRTVAASPSQVYDVWLDSKSPGSPWFGARKVILDPRVDGLFYHCVEHEGREWAHYGRFLTLERPGRIAHTWVSEGTRGAGDRNTVHDAGAVRQARSGRRVDHARWNYAIL